MAGYILTDKYIEITIVTVRLAMGGVNFGLVTSRRKATVMGKPECHNPPLPSGSKL